MDQECVVPARVIVEYENGQITIWNVGAAEGRMLGVYWGPAALLGTEALLGGPPPKWMYSMEAGKGTCCYIDDNGHLKCPPCQT